jgi:excisionase family DNA binding protein
MGTNGVSKEKKIMTAKEVSVYLRIPLSTIYGLSQKGMIRGKKIGKHWRYLEDDIQRFFLPLEPMAQGSGSSEGTDPEQKPEIFVHRILKSGRNPLVGEQVNVVCRIPGSEDSITVELKGRIIQAEVPDKAADRA